MHASRKMGCLARITRGRNCLPLQKNARMQAKNWLRRPNYSLKSDRFLRSMPLKVLSANFSERNFCQNRLAKSFLAGFHWGTMGGHIALKGTHHASVHLFTQVSGQLAAGTPSDVSSSASPGLLLVDGVPSALPGQSDHQRVGATGSTPYRRVASSPAVDRRLLALADSVVVVCGPSPRHAAATGGWGMLPGR